MTRTRRIFLLLGLATATLAVFVLLSQLPHSEAAVAPPPSPTFEREGVAFLQKHCVACHNAKTRKADLALDGFTTDASLLKHRKLWQNALQMVKAGEMPPASRKVRPSPAEIELFSRTVHEAHVRAERNARPDPGRVTVRRLNRFEYNNTIRDLVGVDFNPAEDFPADDVGHGFDNIGDVLTLSPVLLERYLAAAESILDRAIVPNPPRPPQRWMSSRYLEPAQGKSYRFRPLDPRGNLLHTPYKLSLSGEYVFRVRAWAKQTDAEPVKVAIFNGKTELKRFDVTAPEKSPTTLEVKVQLPRGDHRFFVKLLNPSAGANGRTLFVEWFNLNGPSDTRPETQRKLLAVTPGKSKAEQTREVVERFASRAFRRPATKAEVDRLVRLVEQAEKRGEKWEAGVQLAFQAVLVSPRFLFRVELDDRPLGPGPQALNDWQLASRLSYFLWGSMPDEELFDLARRGQLTANLDRQVARMLRDPKARALVDSFAIQWLQLGRLEVYAPDPKLFPRFTPELRAAMLTETKLFFESIVREDRSILELIDGRYTYLNELLARHYGIVDTVGNRVGQKGKGRGTPIRGRNFVRVDLQGPERGGILTMGSVLTVTSNPTRTSPVKRGRWILEQILGTPPPPPPPDVPELREGAELKGTLRQRMEQHRVNPTCASCHARMDPLGFAFENYDGIGAWRTRDGGEAIDASGTLPDGKTFNGPAGLKAILKDKKDLVARNLTEKLLTYALGRGLEHYDRPAVERIVADLERNDYKFSVLVTGISRSFPFRMRRGKDGTR